MDKNTETYVMLAIAVGFALLMGFLCYKCVTCGTKTTSHPNKGSTDPNSHPTKKEKKRKKNKSRGKNGSRLLKKAEKARLKKIVDAVKDGRCKILKTLHAGDDRTVKLIECGDEEYVLKLVKDSRIKLVETAALTNLRRSNCPGIVKIIGNWVTGEGDNTTHHILQEKLESSLKEYFEDVSGCGFFGKKLDRPPPEQGLEWMLQVAEALKCIHDAELTHGDIKPANICLTKKNNLKIIDFGACDLIGEKHGTVRHTGVYECPPEVNMGFLVKHGSQKATDIYYLGYIFQQILEASYGLECKAGSSIRGRCSKLYKEIYKTDGAQTSSFWKSLLGDMTYSPEPEKKYKQRANVYSYKDRPTIDDFIKALKSARRGKYSYNPTIKTTPEV